MMLASHSLRKVCLVDLLARRGWWNLPRLTPRFPCLWCIYVQYFDIQTMCCALILQYLLIFFHSAVFKDLISTEINNNSRIVVIATSKSHDSLHPSLLTSRGCHVFQCRAELHPPDADQRQQILSAMMAKLFRHRDCDKLELRSRLKLSFLLWKAKPVKKRVNCLLLRTLLKKLAKHFLASTICRCVHALGIEMTSALWTVHYSVAIQIVPHRYRRFFFAL